MGLPVKKEDIIRIEMIDKPHEFGKGHGLYEWRYCSKKFTLDIFDLKREIETLDKFKKLSERILDRIYNFRVIYLNIRTGEVTSR